MRQRIICLILVILVMAPALAVGAPDAIEFGSTKWRYLDSEDVVLRLENDTSKRVELFGGAIRDRSTGDKVESLEPQRRYLPPDSIHEWTWSPRGQAGRFVARFRTSAGRLTTRFQIGVYFTIAFDTTDDAFVIYVRREKPIGHLREDLAQPEEERRIVSGIVRRAFPYNPAWSYSMGPGSIILGEVWIEVCDANPHYVEKHRKDWMGERWCPWSSYVAFEGR